MKLSDLNPFVAYQLASQALNKYLKIEVFRIDYRLLERWVWTPRARLMYYNGEKNIR